MVEKKKFKLSKILMMLFTSYTFAALGGFGGFWLMVCLSYPLVWSLIVGCCSAFGFGLIGISFYTDIKFKKYFNYE